MASDNAVTGPINTGNPGEFSTRELAETVVAITGSRLEISILAGAAGRPPPALDVWSQGLLARETIGWAPTFALNEGLARTVKYFRAFARS